MRCCLKFKATLGRRIVFDGITTVIFIFKCSIKMLLLFLAKTQRRSKAFSSPFNPSLSLFSASLLRFNASLSPFFCLMIIHLITKIISEIYFTVKITGKKRHYTYTCSWPFSMLEIKFLPTIGLLYFRIDTWTLRRILVTYFALH